MDRDAALEYLLGTTCGACGGKLAGPGEPCDGCGRIPDVTGPELAAALDGPLALAAVEAAKLRAEAWALHDAAVAKMTAADRAVLTARLEVRRGEAQAALDSCLRAHKGLYGPRAAARKAEAQAAAGLAAATAEHQEIARAEELARRMRHGVAAETEAAVRLDQATRVLRRYQDDLAAATAAREQAEQALAVSAARAALLEQARDKAVAAVTDPGRVPLSGETVTLGGLRLLLTRELDDVELMMAGQAARLVCAAAGVTADIETDVRRQIAAEAEAKAKSQPLLRDRDGTVVPNPLNMDLPSAAPQGRSRPPGSPQRQGIVPAAPGQGGFPW